MPDPTYTEAIRTARLLIEPGENPEYERGMAELIGDLWAIPHVELGQRREDVLKDIYEADIYDEQGLRMIDTVVAYYPGDDDDPPGYVAFAKLSDGTLSFPMGTSVRATRAQAEADRQYVRYDNGIVAVAHRETEPLADDTRCTANDTSVPIYARMHRYDISLYRETGRLRCPCGQYIEQPNEGGTP